MPKGNGSGLLARIVVAIIIIAVCTALFGRVTPHIGH